MAFHSVLSRQEILCKNTNGMRAGYDGSSAPEDLQNVTHKKMTLEKNCMNCRSHLLIYKPTTENTAECEMETIQSTFQKYRVSGNSLGDEEPHQSENMQV